ncbi:hypothetical protein [Nonomuraea helvata]|uniref:Transposase n=1 Tax=Nonomuraea helvata TaxID=37484 RepID=A0ABV5S5M9_9ACTN
MERRVGGGGYAPWRYTATISHGMAFARTVARSVGVLLRWNGTAWQQAPKPPLLDDYRIK